MNFNFSLENSQVSAAGSNYFKPYTINKINKIEAKWVNGNKDGKDWKAIDVTFTGKDGSIRERYFVPMTDEEGVKRGTNQAGLPCFPSAYETLKQLAIHVLGNFAPAQFEKFKKYVTKVKNMQQFLDGFIKLINEAPENEIDIKVVGRNSQGKVYASLPRPCSVSKGENDDYMENGEPAPTFPINFLGNNLEFTAYEVQQSNKMKNAKPTKMDDAIAESVDGGSDDLNLEELDLDSL